MHIRKNLLLVSLEDGLNQINWIVDKLTQTGHTFCLVTLGEVDLRALSQQNLDLPSHYSVFFDVIEEVGKYLSVISRARVVPARTSLKELLETVTGTDVANPADAIEHAPDESSKAAMMADIVIKLLEWSKGHHEWTLMEMPFKKSINVDAQLESFLEFQSNVVRVIGFPMRIAYS